ncbi:DUF397 domain-containing protein [Plantactinospora sp. WMMB782]|uniref:DUF397 domain-containing protein n=1 Tax=Plantactinospora sp. WMMB782 TaxID=3404121 RepID=UPI003B935DD0
MTAPDLSQAAWRKSSRSGANDSNCVEVAGLAGAVGVRDSKDPTGPVLRFSPHAWTSFTSGLQRDPGFTSALNGRA